MSGHGNARGITRELPVHRHAARRAARRTPAARRHRARRGGERHRDAAGRACMGVGRLARSARGAYGRARLIDLDVQAAVADEDARVDVIRVGVELGGHDVAVHRCMSELCARNCEAYVLSRRGRRARLRRRRARPREERASDAEVTLRIDVEHDLGLVDPRFGERDLRRAALHERRDELREIDPSGHALCEEHAVPFRVEERDLGDVHVAPRS